MSLEPSSTGSDRGHLLTEQPNPASEGLDRLSTDALVDLFCENERGPQRAVAGAAGVLAQAIDAITDRLRAGGRLFYLGAGTSGRLGVLDAAECPPTFCTPPELVQGVLAGGAAALLRSSEGLEDLAEAGRQDLEARGFSGADCLVGIAAGGTTPYVHGGLTYAREIGALAIAMACVPAAQAPMPCDLDIRLLTGPELLTGSTRLKAGTATKMALNILSTGVMVRLGKVHGNRMVDVAVTNSKLEDRALRILRDLAGVDRQQGAELLDLTGGSVKLALLLAALITANRDAAGDAAPEQGSAASAAASTLEVARGLLDQHGPSLRATLAVAGVDLAPGVEVQAAASKAPQ
ncbi:N-acetylmuramic acid 6-phosphate etherase [Synechococcus sp. CBW1002]|uniref:N-acetylmuramic acid 6-phosphate etherase n=1 Tax=Synechococcus sp. CBW1002 TaxID=1353134 RepID=UPI0018CD23E1|nr:N-acetylmuramic acid 6-phosphate etherase [Synechococcus sp. CBW1002]QPN59555.1 N-acetylmuramic acid 6-phosphate etherase [Synechococcus sp. CBW1002]